ncbi:MAG TPA: GAF domain-containing protein, partial [Roseiflexaceae bacterium]|nr:GAF domain-containing protein [Roseiflexaceae bacterium]
IYQDERDDITIAFTVDEQVRQFEMNNGSPRAGSLSHWSLTNRQPLRFTNLPEQIEAYGITPRSFGNTSRRSASWLGVPLLLGESKIMGVIGVQSYTPNLYSDREQAFLMTVARQVALGIQNALLYNQAQAQVRQLALINQVSATAAETLEVDTVLQATVTALLQATEADQARLALYDREQGIVTVQAEAMLSGMQYESTARLNEQPLVAWLDQNRRPYLAQDAQRDPMIATWHDSLHARDVRSVLAIPLVAEQVIGVVWLDYVGRQSDAGQRELELALTIANQTAVALEKARLFHMTQQSADALQHKVGELSALLESARVLSSSLQPQEVLNSLMAVVQRHLRVDTVALWQNDGEDMLLPAAMLGIPTDIAQTLRVPVGQGLTGRVAAASTPMIVDNVEQDGGSLYPDFNRQNQYTSFLGVPVRYRERTIGVLSVMTVQQRTFTQDDVQLLTGMADQAAVAIENARLFEEREKRLRELIALKDISSEITSTLDMQDVLERLHFQISQVIDVRTSAMVLYDRDQDRMVYAVAYDQGQRIDVPPQPVIGPAGWVIRNKKPLLLHTHEELIQLNGSGLHFGDTDDEEQSFVVVPIISGDTVLGVIDIQSYEPHAFDDDDLRFLGTVASQASISMTNASLFYERGRRIEELATFNRLGQEISAIVSQDELLDVLYRQTSRLLDVKNFHVALYDERRNTVTLPLVVENDEVVTIGDVLTLENTLTGYVLRTRSPLLINSDLENELERRGIRALKHIGPNTVPRSWLGVPMITADKVIGAIGVQSFDRELAFSQDDVRLLQTIAAWSATALENARLLGETRQSVQDLTALYDVSVLLAGQLNAADILTSTASSVLELLSADVSVVFLTGTDDNMPPVMIDLSGESDQPALLAAFEPLNDRMLSATAPTEIEPVPAEIQRSAGLRSLLGVPIVANDRHIGVVWVGNRTVRNWDGRAVSLSSIFSNQLSQTLARAELFRSEQARRRVADTLRETAQIFTTLRPFNDILELIFDQLGHVLPYDSASVMLREDNELHIVGGRGFTSETQTVIKNLRFTVNEDPHLEQVMTTRQPLVLDDAQASPYFVPAAGTEHIRGWIAAPILADDEVVGLVTVDSHEIGAYDADDAQLVFALASQAAQAIRNAYQYEQITSLNADLERRVAERTAELEDEQDRLRAVHAITLELTATLELELTLNKALELAARAVGAQRGSIMLREADGDALTCRAVLNPDGEVVTTSIPISFADGGGLSGWIINARSAVCIADVRTDNRWLREEGRADEVRSVIAAPLMTQDGPLGVLMLSSPHEAFFGDAQLQLLTTIGNEIAIVIHNAALYKVISELAYDRGISEAQQREENSKNQAILQSLGEGVMVFDEQQQVVLFNPAAEQMLGIPASALAGQSLKNVRTQATAGGDTTRAEHVYTGLNDGLRLLDEQGRNYNRMLELSAPSQTIALNFAPWVGPRGAVYGSVVVMRDVTREIESDRAKREFISSVSHELRTPLTSIKGYVDLLMLG